MNNKKTLLSLISLFFIYFVSYSQKSLSVNTDSLNSNLLETLIKLKIDSVRKIHNKKTLTINDTLKKSAQDQAMYIKKLKKLSHFQTINSDKKTVDRRVAFYGLKNTIVAENIAYTFVFKTIKDKRGKEYINTTYKQIANDFVTGWVNSSGHYKNLINEEYSLTGVAVSFDKANKKIYAVQVFSSENN